MKKLIYATLIAGMAATGVYADEAAPEETMKFKGDIRIRLESIDKEGSDTRDRGRYRARFQIDAEVNDQVDATIAIASGSDDPVSSNESFDGGFSSKGLNIDQAVLKIKPNAVEGLKVQLGKMKTPFIQVNNLVYDSDLRTEGGSLHYKLAVGENAEIVLNGGAFAVEERSSDDDTYLYGGQIALVLDTDGVDLTAGASFYYYDNIEGFAPVYDEEDSFGNATTSVLDPVTGDVIGMVYANGYEIIELFAQAGFDVGIPVSVNGSYVMNEDADVDDKGYQAGVKFGKRKKPGSYDFGYAYRELEANAVLGAFTDSDAYGGGTDGKSHIITAGYQIAENLSAGVTYFTGQDGIEGGKDYDRIQIDLVGKF